MTSKLPVVGQRYRKKATYLGQTCSIWQISREGENTFGMPYFWIDEMGSVEHDGFSIPKSAFWDYFEELPDSNPQEVEEDCPFETAAEEWNTTKVKEVSEKFYCKTCLNDTSEDMPCRQHSKDICCACHDRKCDERIEDYNKVSEVERVLEELKKRIDCNYSTVCNTTIERINLLSSVVGAAENLVDALKAEKDMSKPEPKIDMKEKRVEPVSTLEYVNNLIYNSVFSPEQIIMFEVIIGNLKQMQKDIEELKKKL